MEKYPINSIMPAWYELGISDDNHSLLLRIHEKALHSITCCKLQKAPIVKHMQERFKFGDFHEPSGASCGFNGALVRIGEKNGWVEWKCPLPILYSGKLKKSSHENAYPLRASLAVLFMALSLFTEDTGWEKPQLMVVEGMRVDADFNGGALSVTLTPAMCQWLARLPENAQLPPVIEAMKRADSYMWQKGRDFLSISFDVICRSSRWIHLTVPGNACGLDPDGRFDKNEWGYTLVPHNVDSSIQQLALLMGLGSLHDIARRS